jgi:DNA polymerase III subunit alpha
LFDLASARTANAETLLLACNGQADAARLKEMLVPYLRQDACKIVLDSHNASAMCELPLPDHWRVELRDELLDGLRGWLNEENVKILYH